MGLRRFESWTARVGLVAVTGLLLLLVAAEVAAQPSTTSPDPGSDSDRRIQILGVDEGEDGGEDEVVLELAVPPAIGRLTPVDENFGVTDGGRLVDVSVTRVGTAADIVMVVDVSGSMRGSALDAAKAAATGFIEALPQDARVGLISFGSTVETHRRPTLDRAELLADLQDLEAVGTETVLWDSLVVAADLLAGSDADQSSIVVLSDGDDTASAAVPAAVADRLGNGSTVLYAVAIESPDTDLVALEETVALVDGQFLATTDLARLDSLYTEIAGRLANRYRLTFTPAGSGSRSVVVSVDAGGSVATARIQIGGNQGNGITSGTPVPDVRAGASDTVLDGDDPARLGTVVAPALGPLGGPLGLWLGLGSMFGAFAIVGLMIARPAAQVRLEAAAGADRLGGINARLGHAADQLISRHDSSSRIDTRLEAADFNLRPGEFVVAWLLATGAAVMAAWALFGLLAAVLTVPMAAGVALIVLGLRTGRRRKRFADQLTETLGIIASSLRAGQSLPRSIELVATEAPSPTSEQFHRISFEVRVGRDLPDSIREAARRMDSPDLVWLAQAVDINRELGGDLTEVLDNVAATIRERRTVARQIDALSAEGRATGWVLLGMPIVLFLFSWWRTPDSIEALVTEPIGRVLLAIAASGMTIGHVWIRHLVKLKF